MSAPNPTSAASGSPESALLSPEPTKTGPAIEAESSDYSNYQSDAGLGSEFTSSSTTSLRSSIFNYKYENGRRYHAFGQPDAYPLPNDEPEQDRLDLYHHVWTMVLGGDLYTAPLEHPQMILDIGTGTGIWAIDIADMHPGAKVIGNDLSAVQPTWVPPNVQFEIDDMELPWTYPLNHFDFIHLRTMSNCFKDWDVIVQRAYDHLAPGGYIEIQDYDYILLNGPESNPRPISADSPFLKWRKLALDCATETGRPFINGCTQPDRLKRHGFINVTAKHKMWPCHPWNEDKTLKEVGHYVLMGMREALQSYAVALLTRIAGWTKDDVLDLCKQVERELKSEKEQYWQKAWFVYGQKPLEEGKK